MKDSVMNLLYTHMVLQKFVYIFNSNYFFDFFDNTDQTIILGIFT